MGEDRALLDSARARWTEWTYDVVERVPLQTPTLAIDAFHLKPRPVPTCGNITAEMWFAPALQYLPVRIRINQGRIHLDLLVDRIEQK